MAAVRVLSTTTATTAACAAFCSLPKEVSATGTITFTAYGVDSTCTTAVDGNFSSLQLNLGCEWSNIRNTSSKTTCDGVHVTSSGYLGSLNCDNVPNTSVTYEMNKCVESQVPAEKGMWGKFTDCTNPTSHSTASPLAIVMAAVIASAARFVLL